MDQDLKSISIKNFKGLKQLELNDLNQINIIVGDNNIGKTNLLEAIYILQSPYDFIKNLKR